MLNTEETRSLNLALDLAGKADVTLSLTFYPDGTSYASVDSSAVTERLPSTKTHSNPITLELVLEHLRRLLPA